MTESSIQLERLPGDGAWMVFNSPASRVPSHGTDIFGQRYAIDLLPVGSNGPDVATWRDWVQSRPLAGYGGYGTTVRAPAAGAVVAVRADARERPARSSVPGIVVFTMAQLWRSIAWGGEDLIGNQVTIRIGEGQYLLLAHLMAGSITVEPGDEVEVGDAIGRCGNSGNSTQPHVHIQVFDGERVTAKSVGRPFVFAGYHRWCPDDRKWIREHDSVPKNGEMVSFAPAIMQGGDV